MPNHTEIYPHKSMKRIFSLRLPLSLLPLLAILSLLSCRTSIRQTPQTLKPSVSNTTILLRLASYDPSEPVIKKDVEKLLEGFFPSSIRFGPRSRRLDRRIFPSIRRSLRNWWRNRVFQPEIMSQLAGLVNSSNLTPPYASCAVVGNSGVLLKSDHGDLIDGHDLVVRLNNARTLGYQRKVGSKTGLSFVNSNILHLCARRLGCFCHPYGENVPIVMYICQAVHFLDYDLCNSSHKAPLIVTDARFDMLCGRIVKYYSLKRFAEVTGKPWDDWAKFHDEATFHYSSGMQAVMLALGICDRVSVFGFGKSKEAKHHYHTNQKAELDLHDYDAEYAFYEDLVDRPQEIPFLKDSGFKVPPLVFYH